MELFDQIKTNLSILAAYEFLAIQLRYQGLPYKIIAREINKQFGVNYNEQTIAYWFYKKGRLSQIYREYAETMVDLEIEETRDFIKGNLSKAAKTLARVMAGQGGPAQVMAAKEFLDRGLGKVKEEVGLSGKVEVDATLRVLDVLKAIKEIQKNERAGTNSETIEVK